MTLPIAADGALLIADFAESVRFRVNTEGDARTVSAVVNRGEVEDASEQPFAGIRPATIRVMLQNDAADGATAAEVVEDESEIEVAWQLGDTARWRRVHRILKQNAAVVLLEVTQ